MTVLDETLLTHVDNLLGASKAKSFLGREFLTWLWFYAENTESILLSDGTYGNIWIDDRMVLESPYGRAHIQTLKGGEPSRSLEAASSLAEGKTVKEMKLGMSHELLGDFTFTLNSLDLSPRAIKLPDPSDDYSQIEHFSLVDYRLKASRLLVDSIDSWFSIFLEKRTHEDWSQKEWAELKKWVLERSDGFKQQHH